VRGRKYKRPPSYFPPKKLVLSESRIRLRPSILSRSWVAVRSWIPPLMIARVIGEYSKWRILREGSAASPFVSRASSCNVLVGGSFCRASSTTFHFLPFLLNLFAFPPHVVLSFFLFRSRPFAPHEFQRSPGVCRANKTFLRVIFQRL